MDRLDVQDYCLTKPGSYLDEPWEDTVVVKVRDKIFAFLGSHTGDTVGLKCGVDRHEADEWLEDYPDDASSMPYLGYRGWNSLRIGGAIPDEELRAAIDVSYELVVSRLPKPKRPLG